jgi:hypothetical protein
MHVKDGEIKAFQDGELPAAERQRVKSHLERCEKCRTRAGVLSARAQGVNHILSTLNPDLHETPLPTTLARARLEKRITQAEKEHETMWQKLTTTIFSRRARPALAALAVLLLLAVALAFPPVQAIAESFLGLFRVQQVAVVPVSMDGLPEELGSSSTMETFISNQVDFEPYGEAEAAANVEEASAKANFPVRLPAANAGDWKLEVQPGGKMSMKVNLKLAQAVLEEIGRSDIQLPQDLDGADVSVDVPVAVQASLGACRFDPEQAHQPGVDPDDPSTWVGQECTTLIQMPSPDITAPADLDLDELGVAFLQLMGMDEQQAADFARNINWQTTFVLPIPREYTTSSTVQVDGVEGTLIQRPRQRAGTPYMLIWVKNDIVYSLGGVGDISQATQMADSLK